MIISKKFNILFLSSLSVFSMIRVYEFMNVIAPAHVHITYENIYTGDMCTNIFLSIGIQLRLSDILNRTKNQVKHSHFKVRDLQKENTYLVSKKLS